MSGEILGERKIFERFMRRYDISPRGWKFYSGISASGNPEVMVTGKENWIIRRDRYAPDRPGIGISMENTVMEGIAEAYSGLRPVADDDASQVISMISRGVDLVAVMNYVNSMAARVVRKQNPLGFKELNEIRPRALIQGPIVSSERPLQSIVRGQRELDDKLDRELFEMKRKYASRYIG
jgi:hypothetical protein